MKQEILLTLDNFSKIFGTEEYAVRENEIIERYGLTAFDSTIKWNTCFILGDNYYCDDCDEGHSISHIISLNKQNIFFSIPISNIRVLGETISYIHKGEIVLLGCGDSFTYNPIAKDLVIHGRENY
jgi:hypothetical protein